MTLAISTPTDNVIELTRKFAAPRPIVFDAHTKPELLRRWFGPHGWRLDVCEIDLRVGGAWYYLLRKTDGTEMVLEGTYLEIDAPARLVTTESNVDCYARAEHETLCTLTLTELGDHTLVTNTIHYPSREVRDAVLGSGMEHGVTQSYDRLADLVEETT